MITQESLIQDLQMIIILSAADVCVMFVENVLRPTYEKVETIPLIVIKKDNNREQYDRSKIEAGILRACHKRPVSANQIDALVDEIETEIFNREEKEIASSEIGEIVMDKLKDLEAVAYVRFASVYREFKDINTFMDELKKILDK